MFVVSIDHTVVNAEACVVGVVCVAHGRFRNVTVGVGSLDRWPVV